MVWMLTWSGRGNRVTAVPPESDVSPRRLTSDAAQVGAWGFGFVILRVFAVSGYQWDTAFVVSTTLSLSDGLALLFGSLLAGYQLTAVLLMWVLPLLVAEFVWGPRGRRPAVMLPASLGLVTLVALTMSFHLWWLPVSTCAVLGLFALTRRLPAKSLARRAPTWAMAKVSVVAGVAVLLIAAFDQTPWVPLERIETTSGTIPGYVLSVDSGFLNVLTEDHQFVIVVSGDVLSRK